MVSPPSSHPQSLYAGWFSPESQSVHIAEEKSIRALWEQGFFGKGTLSRSEPNWLKKENRRRGDKTAETAEESTRKRRAERQKIKWERARKEREAIDQQLEEERKALELNNARPSSNEQQTNIATAEAMEVEIQPLQQEINEKSIRPGRCRSYSPPVGPMQLLLLPNSDRDMLELGGKVGLSKEGADDFDYEEDLENTIVELESLMAEAMKGTDDADERLQQLEDLVSGLVSDLPAESRNGDLNDGKNSVQQTIEVIKQADVQKNFHDEFEPLNGSTDKDWMSGSVCTNGTAHLNCSSTTDGELSEARQSGSPKIVRFSPTVEQKTFIRSSPTPDSSSSKTDQLSMTITDQEHLQLSLEEAFFLSYGLGVLKVLDPSTQQLISNVDLLRLCRMSSCFPPQIDFSPSPDDPFMLSYIVYHHFRSLGWVVRTGIKFSVDLLLYNRGPVFSHAEFAIIILPSYSHPYWSCNEEVRKYVAGKEKRDWHWLHCINRVNGQVKKTLVLVYVDVPPPIDEETERRLGIHGVLGRYGVREVVLQRWLYNRMRM